MKKQETRRVSSSCLSIRIPWESIFTLDWPNKGLFLKPLLFKLLFIHEEKSSTIISIIIPSHFREWNRTWEAKGRLATTGGNHNVSNIWSFFFFPSAPKTDWRTLVYLFLGAWEKLHLFLIPSSVWCSWFYLQCFSCEHKLFFLCELIMLQNLPPGRVALANYILFGYLVFFGLVKDVMNDVYSFSK